MADREEIDFFRIHYKCKMGTREIVCERTQSFAGMRAPVAEQHHIFEGRIWCLTNVKRSSAYVRARYCALLKAMQQEFLGELLEMQALCSVLCGLHNAQPEVRDHPNYMKFS